MRHIDLFSGIGGFALSAQAVWEDEYENVLFCDSNKFCQQVIKKNFGKESLIYDDIKNVTYANWHRLQEQREEQQADRNRQLSEITLLTGGFPCQPFSQAGKRKGTEDDRYLWPEMLRVIQDFKPTWIIAENVRGLFTIESGLVFEQVCVDLEASGYEVQAFIIPAVSVNAPHRRDRVWIIAHIRCEYGTRTKNAGESTQISDNRCGKIDKHSECFNAQGMWEKQDDKKQNGLCNRERQKWEQNWLEVATRLCRVDDELSNGVDEPKLSAARHRVERLKALGNSIVPQVAIEIMKAIKEADDFKEDNFD